MIMIKIVAFLMAVIIASYDIKDRKIKNVFLGILILLLLIKNFITPLEKFNILPIIIFTIMLPSYEQKWIGAGDLKYLIICGWFFVYDISFVFYLYTFLIGGCISAYKILNDHFKLKKNKQYQKKKGIPYGVGISIAFSYFVMVGL